MKLTFTPRSPELHNSGEEETPPAVIPPGSTPDTGLRLKWSSAGKPWLPVRADMSPVPGSSLAGDPIAVIGEVQRAHCPGFARRRVPLGRFWPRDPHRAFSHRIKLPCAPGATALETTQVGR
jgi:hypothetical protein